MLKLGLHRYPWDQTRRRCTKIRTNASMTARIDQWTMWTIHLTRRCLARQLPANQQVPAFPLVFGKGFQVFTLLSETPWPYILRPVMGRFFDSPAAVGKTLFELAARQRKAVFEVILKSIRTLSFWSRAYPDGFLKSIRMLACFPALEMHSDANDCIDSSSIMNWCTALCCVTHSWTPRIGDPKAVDSLGSACLSIPDRILAKVGRQDLAKLRGLWAPSRFQSRLAEEIRSRLASKLDRVWNSPTDEPLLNDEREVLGWVLPFLDAAIHTLSSRQPLGPSASER